MKTISTARWLKTPENPVLVVEGFFPLEEAQIALQYLKSHQDHICLLLDIYLVMSYNPKIVSVPILYYISTADYLVRNLFSFLTVSHNTNNHKILPLFNSQ